MANIYEPTEQQMSDWLKWVEERPPIVRDICSKLSPWKLYRLKDTGQRCLLVSCSEDGTLTVEITGQYNMIAFDRHVFGINPDDLEECDLPAEGEIVGVFLNEKEQLDFINAMRAKNGLPPLDSLPH